MNLTSFTVEQENLLCIYDTSTRAACIAEITNAMPHFDDHAMREIAESTLAVLKTMTDEDFSAQSFNPAYHNDEEEG
jgi:hypothetical protein